MALSTIATTDLIGRARGAPDIERDEVRANSSAVSWGAILAGAAASASLSLILLILGTGLGLSSVSPWAHQGVSATTFGVSTTLWVTLTQLVAAGAGGYLAGRLRTKWVAAHSDEVYFRDTAHGFLSWAIASLVSAALLTSVIGSILGSGIQAGTAVAGGAAMGASGAATRTDGVRPDADSGRIGYFLDTLFRREVSAAVPSSASASGLTFTYRASEPASTSEVSRIFINTLRTGALPADDVRYVGQLVAQRTGLTQQEAEKRVTDTYARMQSTLRDSEAASKDAADKARKATAYAALWLFISLLMGAFFASLAATYGGRRRDD